MPKVMKKRRVVNPSSRRRKMTPKQIKYFGTKRQKAALKASRTRTRKKTVARKPRARARRNVGEIITLGLNPGRRKNVEGSVYGGKFHPYRSSDDYDPDYVGEAYQYAPRKRRVTKKKGKTGMARKRTVRRAAPKRRVRRRRANPVVKAYYRRRPRRNPSRRYRRRRNPNTAVFTGKFKNVLGVLGGAAATKLIVDRLPYGLATGAVSYLSTAVVAMVLGWGVGSLGKNKSLGEQMTLGGLTYLTLRLLQDFVPSVAAISPIGLRGMGVIGPSNFYTPQVPQSGSMRNFVTPSSIASASAANGMSGLGMNRRFARTR